MLSRTEMLLTKSGVKKLNNASCAVFGLGGVGGHAAEALVRAGVKNITLIDGDVVSTSDLNRQIIATKDNIGLKKVDAAKARLLSIYDDLNVTTFDIFYTEENANIIDLSKFDYVIDAIDSVNSKVLLILECYNKNIPIISSMGAGNKLDASKFEVADIYKTSVCPLAKIMRKRLKDNGIKKLKVVYSKEEPINSNLLNNEEKKPNGAKAVGSVSFVPSVAGLILAGEVIKDIALK